MATEGLFSRNLLYRANIRNKENTNTPKLDEFAQKNAPFSEVMSVPIYYGYIFIPSFLQGAQGC